MATIPSVRTVTTQLLIKTDVEFKMSFIFVVLYLLCGCVLCCCKRWFQFSHLSFRVFTVENVK